MQTADLTYPARFAQKNSKENSKKNSKGNSKAASKAKNRSAQGEKKLTPSLQNPFWKKGKASQNGKGIPKKNPYTERIEDGRKLIHSHKEGGGESRVRIQHSKGRMTIWERLQILTKEEPNVFYQNWGSELNGAGLATGILSINGRDAAFYAHDFTQRAGSMDAGNGTKLARIISMAGRHGIPLIGMNESAGAYVPAGVGGLDGYSEAFYAMRKISGVVPSIMLMFGFSAGGGAYLPRQGSFMIQPKDTFFGLTGARVVRNVLGEDVTPEKLGGPMVHGQSGVVDLTADDELSALRKALRVFNYLPNNNQEMPKRCRTSDPIDRKTYGIEILLEETCTSPTGFNTPFDMTLIIQQICDHGIFFEMQPQRARNLITAFGRLDGYVVGFMANNSSVSSGQIDIAASYKGARFTRFCNLYNIPMIFLEDATGFLPGKDQEEKGIVQAGRNLMESIIDLRVPRINLIVRNAFGGAYAIWNSQHTGADLVITYPSARVAVMGPAGKEFVYKKEIQAAKQKYKQSLQKGSSESEAQAELQSAFSQLGQRYEKDLMNPKEALSLGSISRLLMPENTRQVLAQNMNYLMRRFRPGPMQEVQREFF